MNSKFVNVLLLSGAFAGAFSLLVPPMVSADTIFSDGKFTEQLIPGNVPVFGELAPGAQLPMVNPNEANIVFGITPWTPTAVQTTVTRTTIIKAP